MGAGHVPSCLAEALGQLAKEVPVVLVSRTGPGEILRGTYGFPGSEADLLPRGLVPAGILDGLKARIKLTLLLMAGAGRHEIGAAFAAETDWTADFSARPLGTSA
jgi:L-asparaginase